jgi:ERCC4-type nuclease
MGKTGNYCLENQAGEDNIMIIAPFTVAVDTREQLPFSFQDIRIDRKKAFVLTQKRTLSTGDYSIVNYENRICVERKSLEDLYQTLGNGRERFVRELERMQEMEYSAVVVEASLTQVKDPSKENPLWYSQMNPAAVLGTIIKFAGQFHKTRWKFAGNRTNAEKITFKLLLQYYHAIKNETESFDTRQALGTPAEDFGIPESSG